MALRLLSSALILFLGSGSMYRFSCQRLYMCVGVLNTPKSLNAFNVLCFLTFTTLYTDDFLLSNFPCPKQCYHFPPVECISKSHNLFLLKIPNPMYHFLWHPWTPGLSPHHLPVLLPSFLPSIIHSSIPWNVPPQPTLMASKALFSSQTIRVLKVRNRTHLTFSRRLLYP